MEFYNDYEKKLMKEKEARRKQTAQELGLTDDASWEDIFKLQGDLSRQKSALMLGLNKDATEEEIKKAAKAEKRKARAIALGLPETATLKEIKKAEDEEIRKERAHEYGLSENATWDEITEKDRERIRKEDISKLGLLEDVSSEEIAAAKDLKQRQEKARQLGMQEKDPTNEQIDLFERDQEAKKLGLLPGSSWEDIKTAKDQDHKRLIDKIRSSEVAKVSIAGLDKAKVLVALYNYAKPKGLGVLSYNESPMSEEQAKELLDKSNGSFDYLIGRAMKIDISGDEMFTESYNENNGRGAAEKIIKILRERS